MSIKDEEVMQVPTWNAERVENWMIQRKIPQSVTGIFRSKYQINGEKLLGLQPEEVRELCRGAKASKKHEFILMDSIKMIQRQYYAVQRGYNRTEKQQSRKRKRNYNKKTSVYNINNARKYRKYWDEKELQNAWRLWLKYENLKTVSSKIGRTYIATLTKINLIRRSVLESNNAEYEANITDPERIHVYDLTDIVKKQKLKEDRKDQWERMKETGVNIDFQEFGEMSTDEDYDDSQNNDDEEKQSHLNQENRMRKRGDMSLSESEEDDEPIINRLNNHNKRLKRRFMDKDGDEDEDEDEDEEEIQKKQEELWANDRDMSIEEREKLSDKGIYVVEALRKHKQDDQDEECQFYVKWLDYDSDDNTWEPESNIPSYMVKQYWQRIRKARNSQQQFQQRQRERERERERQRQRQNVQPPKKKRRMIIDDEDDSDIEIIMK